MTLRKILRDWLGLGIPDPIPATREALCAVKIDDEILQNSGLTPIEKRKLQVDCAELMRHQSLHIVLKHLKCSQRDKIARDATKDTLDFARGVLVGINSVKEQIEKLAKKSKQDDDFDPNKVI